jgi:hypothetical protein
MSDLSTSPKQPAAVRPVDHSIFGSDDKVKLFYWVLNKSTSIFSVKIEKSETVDQLMKMIKKAEKPELDHLAVATLKIRKVSASPGMCR